jgi:tetratricopeptide (TPR) repeat protein
MIQTMKRFGLLAALFGMVATMHTASAEAADRTLRAFYGASPAAAATLAKEFDAMITTATRQHGSRTAASAARVGEGADLFMDDDLDGAMRRFNEAWLLDPENPKAMLGFAAIAIARDAYCDAVKMVRLAESKGPLYPGFLPDTGIAYTGCARSVQKDDPELALRMLTDADRYFALAYANPEVRRAATLFHWARAMYARGNYEAAWGKVAEYRVETGKDFNAQFLLALRRKMPEPHDDDRIADNMHRPRQVVIQAAAGN